MLRGFNRIMLDVRHGLMRKTEQRRSIIRFMIFRQMKRKKKHIGNGSAKLLNMLFYNRC